MNKIPVFTTRADIEIESLRCRIAELEDVIETQDCLIVALENELEQDDEH